MKKFYAFAAAAVAALSMNATIYVTGAATELAWDPTNPMVVEAENGSYSFDLTNVSMFKISTAFGEWDAYNAGAKSAEGVQNGEPAELFDGDGNILPPWVGDYHVVIDEDLTTITMTTESEKPMTKLFIRGGMNNWLNDGATDNEEGAKWQFSTEDNITFTFIAKDETKIEAGVEFKIADANWAPLNYSANGPVTVDEECPWFFDGQINSTVAEDFEGTITFVAPEVAKEDAMVTFTTGDFGGVNAVEVAEGEAEYFNLQGVRVANPENGLYIVRQGNKVSKVVL